MTTQSSHLNNRVWASAFILLVVAVVTSAWLITRTRSAPIHSMISLGLTIDMALGIPLLYYAIVCRKLNAPTISVVAVFLASIGIASLLLPESSQFYLDQLKKLLILAELTLLTYLILKLRSMVKRFNHLSIDNPDLIANLRVTFHEVVGPGMASAILSSEVAMLRYGLFAWYGKKEATPTDTYFTIHRESGYVTIWAVMCSVIILETVLMHLLLWKWSMVIAILATVLSVYGLVFFVADLSAMIKRPLVIRNSKLILRVGIRWSTEISLSDIREIRLIKGFDREKVTETLDCSILRDPNVLVELHTPVTVMGLYGIRKKTAKIAFNVDEAPRLLRYVQKEEESST